MRRSTWRKWTWINPWPTLRDAALAAGRGLRYVIGPEEFFLAVGLLLLTVASGAILTRWFAPEMALRAGCLPGALVLLWIFVPTRHAFVYRPPPPKPK